MAINVTLGQVSTLNNTSILNQTNANSAILTTALVDAVSRSGGSPNNMNSPLDMNSNPIINVPFAQTSSQPVVLGQLTNNSSPIQQLTGDVTGTISLPSGVVPTTLATVNSNVGTFGSSTLVPVVTVNAKGLTTAVSTASVSVPQFTSSTAGTVPASGGGTSNFLRADATWTTPAVPAGSLVSFVAYTSSQTITIPTGATKANIFLIGGGGGGGGVASNQTTSFGFAGNGGPGGGLRKYLTGLTPGNTLVLTIGTAGPGGAAGNNNGTSGGNTTLVSGTQTITTLTASGGSGGTAVNLNAASQSLTGAAGVGGSGTNGDINITTGAGVGPFGYGSSTAVIPIQNSSGSSTGGAGLGFGGYGGGGEIEGVSTNVAGGNGTAGICEIGWYT